MESSTEEKQQTLSSELLFLQEIFSLNPKSYWIFNHRRWCLETMPDPDWQRELTLVGRMLDMDSRNYPDDQSAWLYHCWLVGREIRHISVLGTYYDPSKSRIILAFDDEIGMLTPFKVFCKKENSPLNIIKGLWRSVNGGISNGDRMYGFVWIFTFSDEEIDNFSELLVTVKPEWIVSSHPEKKLTRTISRSCINQKFDEVKEILVLMVPKDMTEGSVEATTDTVSNLLIESQDSLLIGTSEKLPVLRREISAIRELLELEPDSKWCLQTLINLLRELKYISGLNSEEVADVNEEVVKLCDKLIHVDKTRSAAIFESSTKTLIESSYVSSEVIYKHMGTLISKSTQTSLFSLTDKKITTIPSPSIFLHIRKLDLSHNKLNTTKFLANLISLQEANLSNNCITNVQGVYGLEYLRSLNLQSNLIVTWEFIENELTKWQGGECKVYLYGNPVIETSNDELITKQKRTIGNIEIVWDSWTT
ncbi:5006_t:CDS:2 [Acaulospora colombiana]|uniref:5006_t:CDS:1 n=1 Tax=Acaulospora colombiana TaxID=27376 RepID=A0ACA9L8B7_9GLOM|nr:5006_t:CDS:2 [Acaulospora colombiana]